MILRYCVLLLFIIFVSQSCTKECLDGDGKLVSKQLELEEFDKIFNTSTIDVFITKGDSYMATLKGDSNIVANIALKVSGGELEIDPGNFCSTTQSLRLDLVVPRITKITNEGTGNIKGNTDYFDLDINNDGTGNIELTGQSVNSMNIKNQGTGAILMYGLGAKDLTIENSGTGDSFVLVSENLDATVSGTGNIYYKGKPQITSDVSGIGQLIDGN